MQLGKSSSADFARIYGMPDMMELLRPDMIRWEYKAGFITDYLSSNKESELYMGRIWLKRMGLSMQSIKADFNRWTGLLQSIDTNFCDVVLYVFNRDWKHDIFNAADVERIKKERITPEEAEKCFGMPDEIRSSSCSECQYDYTRIIEAPPPAMAYQSISIVFGPNKIS